MSLSFLSLQSDFPDIDSLRFKNSKFLDKSDWCSFCLPNLQEISKIGICGLPASRSNSYIQFPLSSFFEYQFFQTITFFSDFTFKFCRNLPRRLFLLDILENLSRKFFFRNTAIQKTYQWDIYIGFSRSFVAFFSYLDIFFLNLRNFVTIL